VEAVQVRHLVVQGAQEVEGLDRLQVTTEAPQPHIRVAVVEVHLLRLVVEIELEVQVVQVSS
jgi:hypothetical protein